MTNVNDLTNFPKSTIVSVNGIELEVFEAGKENKGKPIILCHGFPEHAYSWRYQIPALVSAGYHVIVLNQRGYGNSSCPLNVSEYGIEHLTTDLVKLLEYYGYKKAVFVGHDWGANVVWRLAQLHPDCVDKIINLALPLQERGQKPWLEFMEEVFGEDFYFVHFNKQPGVADKILNRHTTQFLTNIFRKNLPPVIPEPGMYLINLAKAVKPIGEPVMNNTDLAVFISAFQSSGFTGGINWYRNLDHNWYLLANVNPIIKQPTLMIYGEKDMIPKFDRLSEFVPHVDVVSLDCGHWIQQEKPEETTQIILKWLEQQNT